MTAKGIARRPAKKRLPAAWTPDRGVMPHLLAAIQLQAQFVVLHRFTPRARGTQGRTLRPGQRRSNIRPPGRSKSRPLMAMMFDVEPGSGGLLPGHLCT